MADRHTMPIGAVLQSEVAKIKRKCSCKLDFVETVCFLLRKMNHITVHENLHCFRYVFFSVDKNNKITKTNNLFQTLTFAKIDLDNLKIQMSVEHITSQHNCYYPHLRNFRIFKRANSKNFTLLYSYNQCYSNTFYQNETTLIW